MNATKQLKQITGRIDAVLNYQGPCIVTTGPKDFFTVTVTVVSREEYLQHHLEAIQEELVLLTGDMEEDRSSSLQNFLERVFDV